MRYWLKHLRMDTQAWDDFQQWLRELAHTELKALAEVNKDGHDRQKGRIEGVRLVESTATAGEREEKAKNEYRRQQRAG